MTKPRSTYEYPDSFVNSNDRRLRFEIETVSVPRSIRFLPARKVRRYRLIELGSAAESSAGPYRSGAPHREIWSRDDMGNGASPWCTFLHDDGTTAVLHADDGLLVIRADGTFIGPLRVLEMIRAADPAPEMRFKYSTAGIFWDDCPRGYFFHHGGVLHFVLRTWWRLRLVLDATNGRPKPLHPDMMPSIREAEEAWACGRLADAIECADAQEDVGEGRSPFADFRFRNAMGAAQLAGQDRLEAALPLLERLERIGPAKPVWGSSVTLGSWPYSPAKGELDIRCFTFNPIRKAAQRAILQLGRNPAALAVYQFVEGQDPLTLHDPGPRPDEWRLTVARIPLGTGAREILRWAGAPFHVGAGTWEYAWIDGTPQMVQLVWARAGLKEIRSPSSPAWIDEDDVKDYG